MRITKHMDLSKLAALIGDQASREDATIVRAELINSGFKGMDTKELPENEWARIAYQSLTA